MTINYVLHTFSIILPWLLICFRVNFAGSGISYKVFRLTLEDCRWLAAQKN